MDTEKTEVMEKSISFDEALAKTGNSFIHYLINICITTLNKNS
jgi:hypothetical protein